LTLAAMVRWPAQCSGKAEGDAMRKMAIMLLVAALATTALAAGPAASQPASQPEVYQAWPYNAKEATRRQDETAKALGVSKEITLDLADKVQMKLLLIPAGKFMMGAGPKEQAFAHQLDVKFGNGEPSFTHEGPQHEVTITKPFYMGVYHVTKAQFAAFVADANYKTNPEKGSDTWVFNGKKTFPDKGAYSWKNPAFEQADDHPVVCINWDDAIEFCKRMSRKTRRAICLPTEAQWEHACRAGVATIFLWGDDLAGGVGWLNANDKTASAKFGRPAAFMWADGYAWTSPVGKFKPNNFGLYDMVGNADQWYADWCDMNYSN